MRVFTDWCQAWNVRGFVGEIGWNNNDGQQELWQALVRSLFVELMDPAGIDCATFSSTVLGTPGGYLYMYGNSGGSVGTARAGASVTEWSCASGQGVFRGVNFSDGVFQFPDTEATSSFSNLNPGTYGTQYGYGDAASASYFASRGLALIRFGVRWERIQPTLGAALDVTEVARIASFLDRARLVGLRVVFEIHNYGAYYLDVAGTGTRFSVNDGTLTVAHFTDLWARLSSQYKDHAGVWAYGLMNEPTAMTSGSSPSFASQAKNWEYCCQQAVAAIRANSDSKLVMVPGYNWSHTDSWTTFHPYPWVQDSNVGYEAHQYFTSDGSGSQVKYADELVLARAAGYTDPIRSRQVLTGVLGSVDARAGVGVISEGG